MDIGPWNVISVNGMADSFASAAKDNQDIGYWNVNSVTNMSYMSYFDANFN
jgi:hypothetical protein